MMAVMTSFLLSLSAWLALALAMQRHQRDVLGRTLPPPRARLLRRIGWLLLIASVLPLVRHWDALTGVSVWGALISPMALVVVLAITARSG